MTGTAPSVPQSESPRPYGQRGVPGCYCLQWIHNLTVRSNKWWSSRAPQDDRQLVSMVDLTQHILKWAIRTKKIEDTGFIHAHDAERAIEPLLEGGGIAECNEEARKYVLRLSEKRAVELNGGASQ